MQNMFVWQIKTVQWTRDVVTDANTAGFRSVSALAWLKKVRTFAIIIPDTEMLHSMNLSVCGHGCLYNEFYSDGIHNLPPNMCICVIMY